MGALAELANDDQKIANIHKAKIFMLTRMDESVCAFITTPDSVHDVAYVRTVDVIVVRIGATFLRRGTLAEDFFPRVVVIGR